MTVAEKLTKIAENVPKVYEAGKKAEWNAFWDEFQNYGTRTKYEYGFAGNGWNNNSLKPKYKTIKPTTALYMFTTSAANIDLTEVMDLDMSNCTEADRIFASSLFTRIGVVNLSRTTNVNYIFNNCKELITIDKLIVKDDGTQVFNNPFYNCSKLENIQFEGVVGNSINFTQSKSLSADSIDSIFSHLGGTASATLTLPSTARDIYDTKNGSGALDALIAARPSNWTITISAT